MAKILQHWCPFETQFRTLTYLLLSTITFVTILFSFQFLDILQHPSENVFALEVIPKYKPLFGKGLCILMKVLCNCLYKCKVKIFSDVLPMTSQSLNPTTGS